MELQPHQFMLFFAWKNLINERTRLILTLVGVTFAVVLMFFDLGVYLGFVRASTVLIDNAQADIWITIQNNPNFDAARPFPERKLWTVRQVSGVLWAEPIAKSWALLKLRNGGTDTVMMVGFDPDSKIGWPWKLKEGSTAALKVDDTIIFDESASDKLGGIAIGDRLEIVDTQVKVVGLSQEARTFTTYPVAFTNYATAKKLSTTLRQMSGDNTSFIVVKVAPGVEVDRVVQHTTGGLGRRCLLEIRLRLAHAQLLDSSDRNGCGVWHRRAAELPHRHGHRGPNDLHRYTRALT